MSDDTTGKKARRGKGDGSVFRPAYRNRDGGVRESAVWWIQYQRNGERIRESSGSKNRRDAVTLLHQRLTDISRGKPVGPDLARTRFEPGADIATSARGGQAHDHRQISARELLQVHLDRIAAVNPQINAIVTLTPEQFDTPLVVKPLRVSGALPVFAMV